MTSMHHMPDYDFYDGVGAPQSCSGEGGFQFPPQLSSQVTRQVTPPVFAPPQNQITFDYNADYPQGPALQPPFYEEFAPHPCDALKQRVWDESTGQFYKATCLLLEHSTDRAYWMQQQVRKAMFGVVWVGQELQRPEAYGVDANITHWETTGRLVAIKQASLQLLQQAEQCKSAEHPRREHAAMQHIFLVKGGAFESPAAAMERTGVILPQDWLADEHFCYLVMPYCNGGELFDRVGSVGRFTEDEARHWMHQILNSLETLHNAGVAHRDLSLENVMIHNDKAVIIDLGMSLPIPFDNQTGQRRLIAPQGAAGKLKYMAPEVYSPHNTGGFDGFAVDLWATGVIMYIMLTGEVPWQMPDPSDVKFQKFTDGWIEPYLLQQGYPLSANALCLLQRMLWLNPRDRLCIHQIRAHPWMQMGGGSPQPIIRWRSTNRDSKKEEGVEEEDKKPLKVLKPGEIQSGRYSKEDTVSPEDMTVMLETVQKYTRDEPSPEEEIVAAEAKVLSEDDSYVKAMKEALKKKKSAAQA